MSTILTNKST